MKKKTAKKHYSQLYKASTIQQTIYDDTDWNSLTYLCSDHIITVKRSKKHFSKKQLIRLLSDRKTIYKFCDDIVFHAVSPCEKYDNDKIFIKSY